MRPFFKLAALLMLAVWLPATGHCDWEAAGAEVLSADDSSASACGQACIQDVCDLVEGASYTKVHCGLRTLLAPVATEAVFLSAWFLLPLELEETTVLVVDDPPAVRTLDRTWSFVRRTALPARAPDCLA